MNIFVTRHAHRGDDPTNPAGKQIPAGRPLDPDISSIGIDQATRLGKKLKKEANIKVIYASPFLRTVHTAHMVALETGCKIRLEWGITERFYPQWYTEWPGTIERQKLAQMFNTIDLSYQQTGVLPVCPESNQWDAHDRLMKAVGMLDKTEDFLIVTHGEPLISITMGLGGWQDHLPAPYLTGLSHVEQVDGKWIKRLACDTSHLEKALI